MHRSHIHFAAAIIAFALSGAAIGGEKILIVQDELPQMEFLAQLLRQRGDYEVDVKTQPEMPAAVTQYNSIIVFIHGKLFEQAETAFISYTKGGGKLLVLHHSISSGKRANKFWFHFLGVKLPEGDWLKGGYKWIEPVGQTIVSINPGHYITSHNVEYEAKTSFDSDSVKAGEYPSFTLKKDSEVYLNHTFTDAKEKTLLLGFIYEGQEVGGKKIMQHTSGWLKKVANGWLIYLQPGHSLDDMQCKPFQQIVINALQWPPERE